MRWIGSWVVSLVLCGCVAADLGNRAVFADLTYGGARGATPASQPTFQLFTELQADVVGPWNDPQAAADCLDTLTAADLEHVGGATTAKRTPIDWAQSVWTALAPIASRTACAAGFQHDGAQLAWAIAKASGDTFDFATMTWLDPAQRPATYAQGETALRRLAPLVRATPANQAAQSALPTLALSGGAANGAFTAGFLFELLTARELALSKLPEAQRAEADRVSRFSAVVGTSVGSLLAQLLELWAWNGPLTPEQQAWLNECNAYVPDPEPSHGALTGGQAGCFAGWPSNPFPRAPSLPTRPAQQCALTLLERSFADVNEAQLMCAEPGSVLRSVGLLGKARTNFIRFDPMQAHPLDEVLSHFHEQMRNNAQLRVVMSTEFQQNQLVAFDERTCSDAACLGEGLMASLVMPVFARPVSYAHSGFTNSGECGVWFDGGMRSILPSLRALAYSRPTPLLPQQTLRVLAVDTGRLTPLPTPRPKVLLDPMMESLAQFASQQDVTELAFAQRAAELRDAELEALLATLPANGMKLAARPAAKDPRVEGVYVPADVPEWVVVAAGYSFDRYVMRGLFVWGQQVARARFGTAGQLAARLGWDAALVGELQPILDARAQEPDAKAWLSSYSQPVCPAFETWRLEQGRVRINETMAICEEPEKGPAYFTCPSGAWDLGAAEVHP